MPAAVRANAKGVRSGQPGVRPRTSGTFTMRGTTVDARKMAVSRRRDPLARTSWRTINKIDAAVTAQANTRKHQNPGPQSMPVRRRGLEVLIQIRRQYH